jgi:hypothetical protein
MAIKGVRMAVASEQQAEVGTDTGGLAGRQGEAFDGHVDQPSWLV